MTDPSTTFQMICGTLISQPGTSLCTLSRGLRLERHCVQRLVRDNAGCNFRVFQNRCRLQSARNLLVSSNFSVKEIASRLQYRSARAFSRFFCARTGQSPSEYRLTHWEPKVDATAAHAVPPFVESQNKIRALF